MGSIFLFSGAILGGLGVALGAFGAHALKNRLHAEQLVTFETGVRYQMYHALALGVVGVFQILFPASNLAGLSGWSFLLGILLFSGSLYLLAVTRKRWLGAITPLGGLGFLAGWVFLALASLFA
jgi:uncharacterized membrane protein YgdD (TMEM256/DUF423 family)